MIVFSNTITSRLQYILDFIGKETLGEPFQITNDAGIFRKYEGPKINYSKARIADSEFRIENAELLFETGVRDQSINCFETNNYKAFFKTEGDFPFDIFAASFYLLSRYEEYLPHEKDIYGRYAHKTSLAFKENFLHLPSINMWMEHLKKSLSKKYPDLTTQRSSFNFLPTYDIDEAYAYKYKPWWRTMGGIGRSIVNGQGPSVSERFNVLSGKKKDPYDAFEWMDQLHKKYKLNPIYFFLVAGKTGKYDKNISPSQKEMQHLIVEHSKRYTIGIHPSWQSGDDHDKLKFEILKLGHITGRQITCSRQHFIRFNLPDTYRQLTDLGINHDFSMGYGSINGFRASVASPFYWYDLETEKQSKLLIHPFCFMEANSFFEQKFSTHQALEELQHYYNVVRFVSGTLITIWHNSFLGTSELFKGWKEVYHEFISLNKFENSHL